MTDPDRDKALAELHDNGGCTHGLGICRTRDCGGAVRIREALDRGIALGRSEGAKQGRREGLLAACVALCAHCADGSDAEPAELHDKGWVHPLAHTAQGWESAPCEAGGIRDLLAEQDQEPGQDRALADVAAERRRQREVEGWSDEHDDEHGRGELANAGACYAAAGPWRGWAVRAPVPMLLWCPSCGARHIDEGEFSTKPHHTHACQSCGMVWRPAIVPTCGVQFLPGFKNDTPPSARDRGGDDA